MSKRIEIEGQRFNRWTVIEYSHNEHNHSLYLAKCDCGTKRIVSGNYLRRGASKSCGCMQPELTAKKSKLFRAQRPHWFVIKDMHHSMMQRCYDPRSVQYHNYGARGISVCKEWHDCKTYYDWCISNGFERGKELDRTDNNGSYQPDNCRFVSGKENMRNSRRVRFHPFRGGQITIPEFCELTKLDPQFVRQRVVVIRNKQTLDELYAEWQTGIKIRPRKITNGCAS